MKQLRAFLLSFLFILLMVGCANQPYELFPLGVSAVTASTSNARYTYSHGRIKTFTRITATDTTSMEFHYTDEGTGSIVADSTEGSYKLIEVTGAMTHPSSEVTYLVTDTSQVLLQTRRFTYNDNNQLAGVTVSSLDEVGMTETIYELAWEGNNVSEIRKRVTDPSGAQNQGTLLAEYDNRASVYSGGAAYIYTIRPDELYWLSANNPTLLAVDGEEEVFLSYTYNSFGYPSKIQTDRGLHIGHSYVEMR